MQVTDTFLYFILFIWGSIIFIGGWIDRYDWRHEHKEVPIYYANGHKKVVYTICGDTAKVHASGLHGHLDEHLKSLIINNQGEIAENINRP